MAEAAILELQLMAIMESALIGFMAISIIYIFTLLITLSSGGYDV